MRGKNVTGLQPVLTPALIFTFLHAVVPVLEHLNLLYINKNKMHIYSCGRTYRKEGKKSQEIISLPS